MAFFVWGKWRYDLIALVALLFLAVVGIIPTGDVFSGFSHPAVIIVVAVLVLSRGLLNSGLIDNFGRKLSVLDGRPFLQLLALTLSATALSAFIYNVGALALLMPVAIRMAQKSQISPALFLLPMAFGTHLGGFLTLISAIPNIIVATFRADVGLEPFAMFDFALVGGFLAIAGFVYLVFVGWKMFPKDKKTEINSEPFNIEDYMTELRITDSSKILNKTLKEVDKLSKGRVTVVALVRREHKIMAPSRQEMLRPRDVLLVRADQETLNELIGTAGLELIGSQDLEKGTLGGDEVKVIEAVVPPDSLSRGKSARDLNLRWQYSVNLLALARQERLLRDRLDETEFRSGDVLLLQGEEEKLDYMLTRLKLLPLAEREVSLGKPHRVILAICIFAFAIVIGSLGILPLEIAFAIAAVLTILTGFLSFREAYQNIDWSVVVLLAAMVPIGRALEFSGGAETIANALVFLTTFVSPVFILVLVMVISIILSDLINTVGATVLMAPVAVLIAHSLGLSIDPFLMAVAIGGSCAFMTPVGHQSNTLVMGPGGYKFEDYWRMGLPLNILIVIISIPLLLVFWPL